MFGVSGLRTSSPSTWAMGLLAVVLAGCGGAPAATDPSDPPDPTRRAATLAPAPTPRATAAPTTSATESSGSMDSGADWPVQVQVTLSPGRFVDEFADGSFSSTGKARNCGNYSFAPNGFFLGFP